MAQDTLHTFHIPVMGLAFSIDTPLKVARFGIASALSLADDALLEQMRAYYSRKYDLPYQPIAPKDDDYRARRITACLNMVQEVVQLQMQKLRDEAFTPASELTNYFEMLPDTATLKARYNQMRHTSAQPEKLQLQQELRAALVPGSIDVNIMTKLDKTNYDQHGKPLPQEFSDATAALRGFANSNLHASVIFSAGMNMRLFGSMEQYPCFLPNAAGVFEKKIILKVSDYRSAMVQGKVLAKKGLWVSEFRVESGLNCGGHAFATDGYLLGPILEEFKQNREALRLELYSIWCSALASKGIHVPVDIPGQRVTVQGGIGTAQEHRFLLQHYGLDATGWGTPFLLVPEATTVDGATLLQLAAAREDDLYLSPISPLGVPFNALRNTSGERLKNARIGQGKPGSPCIKKHLVSDMEFTEQPLCTASRQYQRRKLEQLRATHSDAATYLAEEAKVLAKECLCDGLANAATQVFIASKKAATRAVTVCPGPNLAYFSGVFKLREMVDHIYGRFNALNTTYRPHMFVNELRMYVAYWTKKREDELLLLSDRQYKYLQNFRESLLKGIQYYRQQLPALYKDDVARQVMTLKELLEAEQDLQLAEVTAS
ncbi:hypothetical protein MKJ04_00210 [Pontibacter sp. E15-1]|uniref:hypothetical protein n=1 Tax=Pontibacter sp. E15-1 TaxID=2919918 RepID=UPI001F4F6570|nr:hypothetical protein [Pontibacter sp. E15-1]MCJ8163244.1 hypothetical protein [Pontibacter sp. E15-1]